MAEKHAVERNRKSGFQEYVIELDPELDRAVDRALVFAPVCSTVWPVKMEARAGAHTAQGV